MQNRTERGRAGNIAKLVWKASERWCFQDAGLCYSPAPLNRDGGCT
jgi:hypothetical protein